MTVYPGVMAARIQAVRDAEQRNVPVGARLVEANSSAVMADPLLRDVIQIG